MSTSFRHMASSAAAKTLLEAARDHARRVPAQSADWDFYYGVQTASQHALHNDLEATRADDQRWLDAESPAFRDGYLKAAAALAAASMATDPPLAIPLPQP